jgi:hypothetical protein
MAGQPITLVLPAIGDANPAASTKITTALTTLETELERPVSPADMIVNADISYLSAGTSYRAKDLLAASFTNQVSALSAALYPTAVYFAGATGNCYVNDGAGNQIQLTSAGAVNVSSTGAITTTGSPAYGSSGVEMRWDAASTEYEARSGSGANDFANIRLGNVILNDGSGNYITVDAPSISADYTLTLPTAVPASTSVVLMAATGELSHTRALSVDSGAFATTLGVTGASTQAAITASGLITANAGVTLGANQNLTLSGTGYIKHGSRTQIFAGNEFRVITNGAVLGTDYELSNHIKKVNASGVTLTAVLTLPFPVGTRITNIQWYVQQGIGVGTYTARRVNVTTNVGADIESDTDSTASATFNFATSTDFTFAADNAYYLIWDATGQNDFVHGVIITYDTP